MVELTDSRLSREYGSRGMTLNDKFLVPGLNKVIDPSIFVADPDLLLNGKGDIYGEHIAIRARGRGRFTTFLIVYCPVAGSPVRFHLEATVSDDVGLCRCPPFRGFGLHAFAPEFGVKLVEGLVITELQKGCSTIRAPRDRQ